MLRIDYGIPEETGISSASICNFINRLSQNGIPMHSLLLFHRDKLITEGYYAPYTANTLHRMFSISKSFTAIAIGLLVDEGRLSLSDKIVTFFPDKVPADVHP
ncbi:MAG: serine hydrolase, partial [Clostridiales bacterium]|nr:serine hydrolase [Clostridiales bacterium]